ncbi:MAG: MBL fold metallo-hydrolase [Candidatus Pacebacteria bacterium]|nr:MBL fold metallo-hydrolase [Candidatus Paceibacterota bacterium]
MTGVPFKVTVLGCGASAGVPRIGNDWGDCDPHNPRNRRSRASILIQSASTTLLVDTGPDLRQQLLAARVSAIDAILWTHGHGDHLNGIDEIRQINRLMNRVIPAYAQSACLKKVESSFPHVFKPLAPGSGFIKPTLIPHPVPDEGEIVLGDLRLKIISLDHGFGVKTMGIRIGEFAYCTDVVELSDDNFAALKGVQHWLVDCLGHRPHPTHSHLAKTIAWIEQLAVEQGYLTHLDIDMDYESLRASLPRHIQPAYDGMVIEIN